MTVIRVLKEIQRAIVYDPDGILKFHVSAKIADTIENNNDIDAIKLIYFEVEKELFDRNTVR